MRRFSPKLQEIIEKLLEKDRDLRYQSAADLRGDLKRLKRDVESGRKTPAASDSTSIPVAVSPSAPSHAISSTGEAVRPASSSAVVAAVGRHKVGTGVTALLGLVVLLAASYGVYSLLTRHRMRPFRNFTVTKVTEEGQCGAGGDFPRRQIHSQPDARQQRPWPVCGCGTFPRIATRRCSRQPMFITTGCDFRLMATISTLCAAIPETPS